MYTGIGVGRAREYEAFLPRPLRDCKTGSVVMLVGYKVETVVVLGMFVMLVMLAMLVEYEVGGISPI
jgi:hypothetical protein